MTEATIWVVCPHAEECQPPGARERQGRVFPRAFNGSLALRHLGFIPLLSSTKANTFVLPQATQTVVLCCGSPLKLGHYSYHLGSHHTLRSWGMIFFQFCIQALCWKSSSDSTSLWFSSVPQTPNPTPLLSWSITVRTVLLQKLAEILSFRGSYRLFRITSVFRIWLSLCYI